MVTMVTAFLDAYYKRGWDDIYFGTVTVDVVGIVTTATVGHRLLIELGCLGG